MRKCFAGIIDFIFMYHRYRGSQHKLMSHVNWCMNTLQNFVKRLMWLYISFNSKYITLCCS